MFYDKFISNFKESYAKYSATTNIMPASTPTTSSANTQTTVSPILGDITTEFKKLESDFVYSTDTTISNLKSEVEKLYSFVSSSVEKLLTNEEKIVSVNAEAAAKVAALQIENTHYSSSIARSNDLITRLNTVVNS